MDRTHSHPNITPERDELVEVHPGREAAPGEAIPAVPRTSSAAVRIDPAAVAAILADTRDVSAMLAEVLGGGEDPAP